MPPNYGHQMGNPSVPFHPTPAICGAVRSIAWFYFSRGSLGGAEHERERSRPAFESRLLDSEIRPATDGTLGSWDCLAGRSDGKRAGVVRQKKEYARLDTKRASMDRQRKELRLRMKGTKAVGKNK